MQSISALSPSIDDRRLFKDRKILQSSTPIGVPMDIAERRTAVNYVAKASFDSGIVLILEALLCSIFCALVVSGAARYRLRCRRSRSEPEIDVGVERAKNDTGKKFDTKALPITVCGTGSPLTGMDCPICLTEFVEGEKVRVLPECYHSFHVNCIDKWVVSNPSCPSCRHSLLHMVSEKSSAVVQPAAETNQGAQMHVNENNDSVLENHVIQPLTAVL